MSLKEAYDLLHKTRALMENTKERNAALQYAANIAAAKTEEIAGGYPPPSGKPLTVWYDRSRADGTTFKSKFKSAKQQGKVFSLIAKGLIPYPRTGRLGASMTSRAYVVEEGAVILVGTNRPGAAYVIGNEEEQSHYHRGTWLSLQTNEEAHIGETVNVYVDALVDYIRGYLAGD